ncbi:hypothetical protein MTO96_010269 [Rhipicephalus appendiculatus]
MGPAEEQVVGGALLHSALIRAPLADRSRATSSNDQSTFAEFLLRRRQSAGRGRLEPVLGDRRARGCCAILHDQRGLASPLHAAHVRKSRKSIVQLAKSTALPRRWCRLH